jgi:hypothetical protein
VAGGSNSCGCASETGTISEPDQTNTIRNDKRWMRRPTRACSPTASREIAAILALSYAAR